MEQEPVLLERGRDHRLLDVRVPDVDAGVVPDVGEDRREHAVEELRPGP